MANGSFQARYEMGRGEDGKRIRKAKYFKKKKEAQEWLAEIRGDVKNDVYIEPLKMTVAQWMDLWLKEYKKNHVKPKTYLNYRQNCGCHIMPLLGGQSLQGLRCETVQKFINALSNEKKLHPRTVRMIHMILHSALEQAAVNEIILKNPAKKVKLPRIEKNEIKVLSVSQQNQFIQAAKNTYQGEIFILILATGLRIGEALALTWDDVNLEKNTLRVNKTLYEIKDYDDPNSAWHMETGTTKTKSSERTIPLLPGVAAMLKSLRHKAAVIALPPDAYVFKSGTNNPLSGSDVRRKFRRLLRRAGFDETDIKSLHIHCLRHTFATRGLERGIELKVMQELLGHSSLTLTADLYTHVLPNKKMTSIMKLKNTIVL